MGPVRWFPQQWGTSFQHTKATPNYEAECENVEATAGPWNLDRNCTGEHTANRNSTVWGFTYTVSINIVAQRG